MVCRLLRTSYVWQNFFSDGILSMYHTCSGQHLPNTIFDVRCFLGNFYHNFVGFCNFLFIVCTSLPSFLILRGGARRCFLGFKVPTITIFNFNNSKIVSFFKNVDPEDVNEPKEIWIFFNEKMPSRQKKCRADKNWAYFLKIILPINHEIA